MVDTNTLAVERIKTMVSERFPDVSVNEAGNVLVSLPENPVICKLRMTADGSAVVLLEAPVLLDVPSPRPSVLRYVLSRAGDLGFGHLVALFSELGPEPMGEAHILLRAHLFAETLTPALLAKAIRLVHGAALREIDFFRQLSPPVGGTTAYGA